MICLRSSLLDGIFCLLSSTVAGHLFPSLKVAIQYIRYTVEMIHTFDTFGRTNELQGSFQLYNSEILLYDR